MGESHLLLSPALPRDLCRRPFVHAKFYRPIGTLCYVIQDDAKQPTFFGPCDVFSTSHPSEYHSYHAENCIHSCWIYLMFQRTNVKLNISVFMYWDLETYCKVFRPLFRNQNWFNPRDLIKRREKELCLWWREMLYNIHTVVKNTLN